MCNAELTHSLWETETLLVPFAKSRTHQDRHSRVCDGGFAFGGLRLEAGPKGSVSDRGSSILRNTEINPYLRPPE